GRGHYDKDRPAIIAWVSRQGAVVIQATKDFTVKTVQKAAEIAVRTGSRLYTDSASSYRALKGYVHDYVNHTKKAYARGEVQENHGAGGMARAGKLAFLQDRGVLKVTAPTVRQD